MSDFTEGPGRFLRDLPPRLDLLILLCILSAIGGVVLGKYLELGTLQLLAFGGVAFTLPVALPLGFATLRDLWHHQRPVSALIQIGKQTLAGGAIGAFVLPLVLLLEEGEFFWQLAVLGGVIGLVAGLVTWKPKEGDVVDPEALEAALDDGDRD